MKKIITISLIIMSSCNVMCSDKKKNEDNVGSLNVIDTMVFVKLIPEYLSGIHFTEKEYTVYVGQDTSSLSCILSVENEDSILMLELLGDSYGKRFQNYEDTSAVISKDPNKKVRYHKLSPDNIIHELKYIFKKISNDYDISKLKQIRFSILLSGNLAIDITNHYLERSDARKKFDYEYVEKYVYNSYLVHDLNQIIGAYYICVDAVHIEKPYFISKNSMYVSNVFSCKSEKFPQKILDFMVLIDLTCVE